MIPQRACAPAVDQIDDGRLFVPDGSVPRSTWALAAGYVLPGSVTWIIDRFDRTAAG